MIVAPMTFKSKLDFQYDPALTALLEQAATIADSCSAHAAAIDREDAFPAQEFGWMAKTELLTAPLYRGLGGVGLGMEPGTPLPLLRLLKNIGRGNLAVGRIYEGHVNALQLLQLYGTSEQIERYAADARQRHLFAVWNAEASDGVKLIPLGNNRYRLDGAKTFASGAGYVTRPFVNGVLPDGGWQMCIVPMDEVGVQIDPSWWQPIGMRASASYRVDFSGVEIDACALIGKPGDYTREPWFTGGSIRFAAVQLGGAEALFDATRTYLQQMARTEDPYQQARAGEMAIAIESGNLWFRGAAEAAERADQAPDGFVAYARLMRTAIEQICLTVMRLAEQSVGARGLLRPHPFERLVRDLTMYLRQPAPDAALAGAGRYVLATPIRVAELWSHANP